MKLERWGDEILSVLTRGTDTESAANAESAADD
jgi:hypothetical protein